VRGLEGARGGEDVNLICAIAGHRWIERRMEDTKAGDMESRIDRLFFLPACARCGKPSPLIGDEMERWEGDVARGMQDKPDTVSRS